MQTPDTTPASDSAATRHLHGSSQTGVRLYNERLVLSLIRAVGSLPKAEIARLTRLSAQTVSVIVRQLEADGLLRREDALKGKVGQPLQPFSLNPDGAFALGLKVGRRSGDMVLVGLDGEVRASVHHPYTFPSPQDFIHFTRRAMAELTEKISPNQRKRIAGLGVAMPFDIWKWEEEAGAPKDVLERWKDFDLTGSISALCNWPVMPCNDATAACSAEQLFGIGRTCRDFAYFYIGYFVGGGLVINGHLHVGATGNAAAFGSIPVAGAGGRPGQLLSSASLYLLERALHEEGRNVAMLWQNNEDWHDVGSALERWIAGAARSLAQATLAVASVTEPEAIIIDGAMPGHVRSALVKAVTREVDALNSAGISPFAIREGTIGINARALGAASLPLTSNFMIDRDLLFKES